MHLPRRDPGARGHRNLGVGPNKSKNTSPSSVVEEVDAVKNENHKQDVPAPGATTSLRGC